jgi:UrcA family protein
MNRTPLGKFVTVTAVALVGFAASNAALATDVLEKHVTVTYADLDLNKPAGVDALYARLRSAARAACGDADARDLRAKAQVRECRNEALASAVAGINHAALTAKHLQRSPERLAQVDNRTSRS